MRLPLPLSSKIVVGLAGLALLLVGCQAMPFGIGAPSGRGDLSVTVVPEIDGDRQVLAFADPLFAGKDVNHAVISLYRCELLEDEVATEVAVASIDVDNMLKGQSFWAAKRDITFKSLHADTYYRVRGFAYSAPGTNPANLISKTDLSSAVDFQTTNDDRPAPIGLRIRLKDSSYDGTAIVRGIDVQEGGNLPNGFVTNIGGHIPSGEDLPTPGTPLPPPSPDPLQDYVSTPTAVAYDADNDTLWIADSGNNMVRRMYRDWQGNYATMHIDQAYSTSWDVTPDFNASDVPVLDARYNNPQGVAVGPNDTVFIADTDNHSIRLRYTDPDNYETRVRVLAGEGPANPGLLDGPKGTARFNRPTGLTYDARSGRLYVADTGNNKIRWVHPTSGETGTLPLPVMSQPRGVAVAGDRLFYTESHRVCSVQIRIVGGNPTYVNQQVVAGSSQGQAVGAGNVAQFYSPGALVADINRNLLVVDTGNHRIQHLRFGAGGTVNVSIFAGGTPGRLNGHGPSAHFLEPRGLAIDPEEGLLFVADTRNHRIRKID